MHIEFFHGENVEHVRVLQDESTDVSIGITVYFDLHENVSYISQYSGQGIPISELPCRRMDDTV